MNMPDKICDKYLGEYGFTIWLLPIGCFFFGLFPLMGCYFLFGQEKMTLEDIIYLLSVNIIFSSIFCWFLFQIFISFKIAQEILFYDDGFKLTTYFRQKSNYSIADVSEINSLKENSYFLKKHRCIQTEKPCLEIKTKDNKRYLISPHMERFDELKLLLEELIKNNKKV